MKFEWDPNKAKSNFEKHRVLFFEAASSFYDEKTLEFDDLVHSHSEKRLIRIGKTQTDKVVFVVFTFRLGKIRNISARKASGKEKKVYEEQ